VIVRLRFSSDGVEARIELMVPETGPVRYELVASGAAVAPGFVVVRADEIPRPRHDRLEFRADGLWAECVEETPAQHWSFGLEAFGLRVDEPGETVGERIAVGYDLEWEVGDLVHGEVLVERDSIMVSGRGTLVVEG
jgi:hypothetical protein